MRLSTSFWKAYELDLQEVKIAYLNWAIRCLKEPPPEYRHLFLCKALLINSIEIRDLGTVMFLCVIRFHLITLLVMRILWTTLLIKQTYL